jgi:shikimate dehydrogenase
MIRLGLIGHPVEHSLSPAIHRAALTACGLEGDYTLFPVVVADHAALQDLLGEVRTGGIRGLNVTIPHKRTIASLLDTLTPTATAVGAVNTVFRHDGMLVGDNTDAPGFLSALRNFLHSHDRPFGGGRSALILGAGGSARAVAYTLTESGWDVTVAARRVEQARRLAREIADHDVHVIDYADLPAAPVRDRLAACALIVNATPIGMFPGIDGSPWPEALPFPPRAALYDLVYVPRVTRLVREASADGVPATAGLEMLVEQALLSFVRWTGHTPSRDVMLNAAKYQLEAVQCCDS